MEHAFSPEIFQRENRITFLKFQLFPGTFQWNARKTCVPLTSQPEFPVFRSKWRAPHITFKRPPQGFRRFTYVSSLNVKTSCFVYWGGIHFAVGILLLSFRFSLSMSQFQPIFVSLVTISAPLSLFKGYVDCRNLPWVPALTGPFPGTNKNDRIIKTSNHLIVSIKLHVDLDVGNVGYIVSLFVILVAVS